VALAALLVCADLFYAGMGYNPAIDREFASQPATGAVRFLERSPNARYVGAFEIPPNVIPMKFGLYEARGYDLPIMRRYDRLWRREVTPEFASLTGGLLDVPLTIREITPRSLHTLRLLGVRHVMQPATEEPLTLPGLSVAYEGPDARVYRVAGALPRAFVVGSQQVVADGDAALDAIASPEFDGARVAVTERRLPGLPEDSGAGGAAGSARIVAYEPERVVVRARADRPGLLVLSDNDYPGWKAKVDGRSVPIERVDYVMRGVRIGAGEHEVEFRYEPLTWRIGWIVSLLALIGLAAGLALGWRRRRAAPA
jgi:Bacterial membrane protein YfhO